MKQLHIGKLDKLKLNTEELENCARWNWIALTDTKKWSKKAEAYFTYVPGKKISNNELVDEELSLCGTWYPVYISPNLYEIAEAYRNQYTFEDSVTSFDGTIDDSSFGSSGRGSGS